MGPAPVRPYLSHHFMYFLFLLFLIFQSCLIECVALELPKNLSANLRALSDTTKTLVQPWPTFNVAEIHSLSQFGRRTCAKPYKWFNPLYQPSDCDGAIAWLFHEELHLPYSEYCEFLSPGAMKRSPFKGQRTPRTYTFRMRDPFWQSHEISGGSDLNETDV